MNKKESHSELWKLYFKTRNIENRDLLIETYLHLVKWVSSRLFKALPPHIKMNDLYSFGISGLIKSIEKYDPLKSKNFESYASFVIKTSIIDELRKQDWIPRSVHIKANKLSQAMESLRQTLGREPSDNELAEKLGLNLKELDDWFVSIQPVTVIPLHNIFFREEGKDLSPEEKIADVNAETSLEQAEKNEYAELLAKAIEMLSKQEQKVLILYYYEDFLLKEIAKTLSLTESRISQIHSKAIFRLRNIFKKLIKETEIIN